MDYTLHSLFGEAWGTDQPERLTDLIDADYDTLDERAKALRALAVQLVHSFERKPISTAEVARKMLENYHLQARKGKWTAVVLDANRERVYVRAEKQGMRLSHAVRTQMFDAQPLRQKCPLPDGGGYLLLYGGSPQVLEDPKTLESLVNLRNEVNVIDVIFWEVSDNAAAFYSVGAGVGQKGNEIIDFPNPALLEKARGL